MQRRQWILTGSWTAILAFVPLVTLAQTITVQVGTCAPMTGNGSVNIATTCGTVTISNVPGTTAKVRAITDGTTDRLVLENALLTTSAAITNFPITFSAPLLSLPATPPSKWYYAEGTGLFSGSGGAPVGDSITFKGWVSPTGTFDQVGSNDFFQVPCGTCGSFSPGTGFKTYDSYGTLNSPRNIKGEVFFTLNNTSDQLKLTSLLVRNGAAPDTEGENLVTCGKCEQCIPRSETGWMCRVLDMGCDACVKDDAVCLQE